MQEEKFTEILKKDPHDPSALRALASLAIRNQNWHKAVELLTKEAEVCEDSYEKSNILLLKAQIVSDKLALPEKALVDVRSAISAYPDSIPAIELEWKILYHLKRYEELKFSLESHAKKIAANQPLKSSAIHLVLSHILQFKLNNLKEAEQKALKLFEISKTRFALAPILEIRNDSTRWEELAEAFSLLEMTSTVEEEKAGWLILKASVLESCLDKKEEAHAILGGLITSTHLQRPLWYSAVSFAKCEIASTMPQETETQSSLENFISSIEQDSFKANTNWLASYYFSLGESIEFSGGDTGLAVEKYRCAHDKAPQDPRPLRALSRLLRNNDMEGLCYCKKAFLETRASPLLASIHHLFLARTLELGLGEPERALEHYSSAWEKTKNLHILESKCEALRKLGRFDELASHLEEAINLTSDPKIKSALTYELATIYQHRLGNPQLAVEKLTQALSSPVTSLGLLRSLKECYADLGAWEDLAIILEGETKLVKDPVYLNHLALRASDLWQRLGKDDKAFETLASIVQRDPANLEALLMLEELCYANKSFENLYEIQQQIINILQDEVDNDYARAVKLDITTLLLKHFNNKEGASEILKELLQTFPDCPTTIRQLKLLAYNELNWEKYHHLLQMEMELSEKHPSLLWRLAQTAWLWMKKADEAVQYLSLISDAGYISIPLLEFMKLLYLSNQKWMEWLACAGQEISLVDESTRAYLFYQMARVHQFKLNSPATTVECYERILELQQDNNIAHECLRQLHLETDNQQGLMKYHTLMAQLETEAQTRADHLFALALLQIKNGLAEDARQSLKAVIENKPDFLFAIRLLGELYEESGNAPAQIEIINKEIKLRKDPRVIVLLLMKQAQLWERLKKAEEAINCYKEALKLNPQEFDALEALSKLLKQEQRWHELSDNLGNHASVAIESKQKVELWNEKARICEEKLNDINSALEAYNKALEVDANHLPSLAQLERLYLITESWENELIVLKRMLDLSTDPDERHRIYFKMGEIYEEKMSAPTAAIASFVKALEIQPEHLRTLDALERLYHAGGDAVNLIPILERKALLLPQEKVRLYLWIGELWDKGLNNPHKAIASLERILEIEPKNLEAISRLITLYEQVGSWESAINTYKLKASAVVNKEEAVSLLEKAGDLWGEKFNNKEEALKCYEEALSIIPSYRPALAKSRTLNAQLERWEEVAKLYTREIEFTTDGKQKAELFTALGKVLEEKILNDLKASQSYEMALRANINQLSALKPLARIYFRHGKWEQADPLYKRWVDSLSEAEPSEERARIFYERGKILQMLSRYKEAVEFYRRSSELLPDYLDPLKGWSELHEERQEWNEALQVQAKVVALLEKLGEKAGAGEALRKMGQISEKIGKADEAIRFYTRSAELAGDHPDTLESLIKLFSAKKLFNNVVSLYDRLIILHQGKPEEATMHLRKGIVLEDEMGEKDRALAEYNKALEINPDYVPALKRKAGVLIKIYRWNDAENCASKLLTLVNSPEEQADVYCLLGKIEQDGKKNLSAARSAYEKALQIMPTHLGAMDSIGTILEAMDDWNGYVQAFEKFLKNIPATMPARIRDIHLRLGQVYRDHLKNTTKAILEFNNAVKADPECVEAHSALAKLYLLDRTTYPQAVRENHILLKDNAFLIEPYKDLAKIFEEQKEIDRSFCLYAILDEFNALGKWEKTNFEARLEHLPLSSNKTIDDETHERAIIHPMARHPATFLLEAMGTALCKLMPTGGARGIPAPSGHSIRKKAGEIASNLGVETFEILFEEGAKPSVGWHSHSTPAMVIDPVVYDTASERSKRFMLGRGLEGIKLGLPAIWGLNEMEVKKRLQLIVKLFKSEVVVNGVSEKDAVSLTKQLKKEIPRKVRKGIEEIANQHYQQEKNLPVEAMRTGLIHSANRAGAIVCGHPGEAIKALLASEGRIKPGNSTNIDIMKSSEQLAEMIRFIVSDMFFITRKKLGFSLY